MFFGRLARPALLGFLVFAGAACNAVCPNGFVRDGDMCHRPLEEESIDGGAADASGPYEETPRKTDAGAGGITKAGAGGTGEAGGGIANNTTGPTMPKAGRGGSGGSSDPGGRGGASAGEGGDEPSSAGNKNTAGHADAGGAGAAGVRADDVAGSAGMSGAGGLHSPGDEQATAGKGDAGGQAGTGETGGHAATGPVCGNKVTETGEACDGNCPSTCSGGSDCMREMLVGSPDDCTAKCMPMTITTRVNGDGCCPDGATLANDSDCSAKCGDGVVSGMETCDGNCPTSCTGGSACTREKLVGSANDCTAKCMSTTITERVDGDKCCPDGAGAGDDKDCPAKCGDGVITGDEQCDPQTSGWTSATCNGSSCTRNVYQGCEADSDCTPGQYCERGLCSPECGVSGECPTIPTAPSPICSQQHRCWLPCSVDADCPSGLGCVFFDSSSWRGILIPAAHLCVQK